MGLTVQHFLLLWCGLLWSVCLVTAWVLPGTVPQDHKDGDLVKIKVNTLLSVKTQVPYSYYHLKFPRPSHIVDDRDNLGEVLLGDKVENSRYVLKVGQAEDCKFAGSEKLGDSDRQRFATRIEEGYVVNWICENLPVCSNRGASRDPDEQMDLGFELGYTDTFSESSPLHHLNNHVNIDMLYHEHGDNPDKKRIVGFNADPMSIKHHHTLVDGKDHFECLADASPLVLEKLTDEDNDVAFTYSVRWTKSPLKWVSRWDAYLKVVHAEIHWFTIINSLMIVLFLSGMMALILLRTLLRDIARYNDMDNIEEAQEESGWKLVHGDVFRKPSYSKLLAVTSGTGVQILGMAIVTLVFAALGILSPKTRGALLQAMLFLYAVMGLPAGYVSSRFNKHFQGEDTTRSFHVTMLTSLLFPGHNCYIPNLRIVEYL
eukprot:GHVQ01011019.1.p1 GENE.GHVQ01011019.1~~GHVQ01011019.1.p1  ORF type:complete len:429 (-),score=35.83 GHVQ01011019.1:73-1359(-)